MPKLMEYVRLPLLSREFLVDRVEQEHLIKNNSACKDYLIEAMKYHLLNSDQRALMSNQRTRPRVPPGEIVDLPNCHLNRLLMINRHQKTSRFE